MRPRLDPASVKNSGPVGVFFVGTLCRYSRRVKGDL
ncbi:hypothetical protein GGP99_000035 [Salinibacter ruber]|uniref:Uncharacterized protein n=1 Tax=Salinibacter ruber TaxID=146919 RepID=A0AAW5P333_9BACT|nr:hypothetical protein [Salinibacter ruber]